MPNVHCVATLKDSDNIVLQGKPIDWYYSIDEVTWTKFNTTNTDGDGHAAADLNIVMDTWFKARFEGSPSYGASQVIGSSTQSQIAVASGCGILGKAEGFQFFKNGTGSWNKGAGVLAADTGLQLGFWIWNKNKAKWLRAGAEVV
jgi:hypothetical protein